VAPLIDRDDRVTQRVEMRGDAVPEPQVRRQSVHQHERRGGALARSLFGVEEDAR